MVPLTPVFRVIPSLADILPRRLSLSVTNVELPLGGRTRPCGGTTNGRLLRSDPVERHVNYASGRLTRSVRGRAGRAAQPHRPAHCECPPDPIRVVCGAEVGHPRPAAEPGRNGTSTMPDGAVHRVVSGAEIGHRVANGRAGKERRFDGTRLPPADRAFEDSGNRTSCCNGRTVPGAGFGGHSRPTAREHSWTLANPVLPRRHLTAWPCGVECSVHLTPQGRSCSTLVRRSGGISSSAG